MMMLRICILHLVAAAAALALTTDAVLHFSQGSGLCQTQACQAVGEYVRFGEFVLLLAGAGFFWLVWLLVSLGTRLNRPFIWHLLALSLFAALAFDGGLLGYQFMGLHMQCALCVGVGVALAVNLLALAWVRQAWMILLIGLVVWGGGFAANSVLNIAPRAPKLATTAFADQPAKASAQSKNAQLDCYFYFSMNCGHCTEVLINLAMNKPDSVNWHMCSIDRSSQNLRKLTWIKEQVDQGGDLFVNILRAKKAKDLQSEKVGQEVQQSVRRARDFFTHRSFRGVPLLIVRQGVSKEMVLTGTGSIAQFLYRQGLIQQWMQPEELKAHGVGQGER